MSAITDYEPAHPPTDWGACVEDSVLSYAADKIDTLIELARLPNLAVYCEQQCCH